jgi:hypothetical protein
VAARAGACGGLMWPWSKISPPQTPQGSRRLIAPARQARRTGQSPHNRLARSNSAGVPANHRSGSWDQQGRSTKLRVGIGPIAVLSKASTLATDGWVVGRDTTRITFVHL